MTLIKYFLNNEEYASRSRELVPRVGDLVRFNGVCYVVDLVVWVEDDTREHVAISIEKEAVT